MQLLPCVRPNGSLESAPHTSLRADTPQERWDGFWCETDERYYTRCVRGDGAEQWYRLVDEAPDRDGDGMRSRVIRFRSSVTARTEVFGMRLVSRDGRRPILVGTARRRFSARTSGAGGGR